MKNENEVVREKLEEFSRILNSKRLPRQGGLRGPEYYGCINSGRCPSLVRTVTDDYVVGSRQAVQEVRTALLFAREGSGDGKPSAYHKKFASDKGCVIRRTRKSAVKHFLALCEGVVRFNYRAHQENLKAAEELSSSDPQERLRGAFRRADVL